MSKIQHSFDELFRRELSDLEISPTAAGRSGFLKLAEKELRRKSSGYLWYITGGIVVAIFFAAGILMTNDHVKIKSSPETITENHKSPADVKKEISINKVNDRQKDHNDQNKKLNATYPVILPSANKHTPESNHELPGNSGNKKNNSLTGLTLNNADTEGTSLPGNPVPIASNIKVTGHPAIKEPVISEITDSIASLERGQIVTNEVSPLKEEKQPADTIRPLQNSNVPTDTVIPVKNSLPRVKEWNISAGIYYTPELIFNTLDSNKYVNNFGVEGTFHFGPYSIRTGLGLSLTGGYHEMVVETQNYLGGYHSLDYITYQWDSKHYHLVPTIYTTWKEVFDTAIQYNYYFYEKQYTYLQVPFILGYDLISKGNWSLGLRAGPVMSVLVKSKVLSGGFDPGKDMIVTINNVTPERIRFNWQVWGGINAAFHFARRLSIELEPNIRYYFDSVYEKNGTNNKPWSVGLRAAFLFNF